MSMHNLNLKERTLYFIKHYESIVGIIEERDNKPYSLEIIDLRLFFDKYNKNVIMGAELDNWVKRRLTPISQRGLNEILSKFGILEDDGLWYWKLFKKTKDN